MNLPEKQNLINKKEWEILKTTDVYNDLNRFSKIEITKDFILEFILNEQYYKSFSFGGDRDYSIFKYINSKINNFNFTVDDWKTFIVKYIDMINKGVFLTDKTFSIIPRIVRVDNTKNVSFIKLLLNDDYVYSILIEFLNDKRDKNINSFTREIIESLTTDEKEKLKDRITFGNTSYFKFEDSNDWLFLELFNNPQEAIDFLSNTTRSFLSYGIMLSKLPHDEFFKIYQDDFEKYGMQDRNEQFCQYYNINDTKIPDIVIENSKGRSNTTTLLAKNLTKDQIIKYKDFFDIVLLIKNKNVDLTEIVKIKEQTGLYDLAFEYVFITDEKIKENPQLFNPNKFLFYRNLYVSSDTFKLLNKTWNKRARYSEDLINFNSIIRNIKQHNLNIKNLKYLSKKTGVSNSDFLNALSKITNNSYVSEGVEKSLLTICKFVNNI